MKILFLLLITLMVLDLVTVSSAEEVNDLSLDFNQKAHVMEERGLRKKLKKKWKKHKKKLKKIAEGFALHKAGAALAGAMG